MRVIKMDIVELRQQLEHFRSEFRVLREQVEQLGEQLSNHISDEMHDFGEVKTDFQQVKAYISEILELMREAE